MKIGIIDFASYHNKGKGKIGSSVLRADNLIAKDKDFVYWKQGMMCDALIFQKVYWLEMAKNFNGIKILDLCDPDFMIPQKAGGLDIVNFSQYVDAITTSSEQLAEQVRKYVKNKVVQCIPDRINFDLFPEPKVHTEKAKRVVWFGYKHNAEETLPQVVPALRENKLKLLIISNELADIKGSTGIEIEQIEFKQETAYYEIQKGDIFINPRSIKSTFKYKSNNKTVIAWKLGLPFAENGDDLIRFLDPQEREKEKGIRLKEVEEKYNIIQSGLEYKQIICNLQKKK